jgi:hypothetical protein
MKKYDPKEIKALYEKLRPDLKEALWSERTAEIIGRIAKDYNLEDEGGEKLAEFVGYVLLGLLPPQKLDFEIEDELGVDFETAKKIAFEISRLILFPVKESLEELYEIEFEKPIKPEESYFIEEEKKTEERKRDIYREPIE